MDLGERKDLEEKSERKSRSWEMLGAVCEQCRERSKNEQKREGVKAEKRTKDESGCRWRGRKESHEMLGIGLWDLQESCGG